MAESGNVPLRLSSDHEVDGDDGENADKEDNDDGRQQTLNNTQDTLTVDVMKLPKSLHQHNSSLTNLTSPPHASTRSSLMSVVPPMANVWLDEEEDEEEATHHRTHRLDSMTGIKQIMIRSRHLSIEPEHTAHTTYGDKRRSRKSLGTDNRNVFDKLKQSFSSTKHTPPQISTAQIRVLWDEPPPTRHAATQEPAAATPKYTSGTESTTAKLLHFIGGGRPTSSENLLGAPLPSAAGGGGGGAAGHTLDKKLISAPVSIVHAEHTSDPFDKLQARRPRGVSPDDSVSISGASSATTSDESLPSSFNTAPLPTDAATAGGTAARPFLSRTSTSSMASLGGRLSSRPSTDSLRSASASASSLSLSRGPGRRSRSNTAMSLETAVSLGITLISPPINPPQVMPERQSLYVATDKRVVVLPSELAHLQQHHQHHQEQEMPLQPEHTVATAGLGQVREEGWF